MASIAALLLALLLDMLAGEPPAALHPVVWVGRAISALQRIAPKGRPALQMAYGTTILVAVMAAFVGPSWVAVWCAGRIGFWPQVVVTAVILKPCFAARELWRAADRVRIPLEAGSLDEAREALRSLVSRNTRDLDGPLLVAAGVESVAENTCDSLVAPLLVFAFFGIPGVVAYRVANTFDAMIGYHGRYEYLGKVAARLDDLLNIIPARLTGLLVILAARITGNDSRLAWRSMWRYHSQTQSPNAGWSMGAMAGALRVELEKAGHYKLGEPMANLAPSHLTGAITISRVAVGLMALVSVLVLGGVHAGTAAL